MSFYRTTAAGALALAACAALGASPALAQNRTRSFEFGVFGGTMRFDTPVLFAVGEGGDSGTLLGSKDTEFFGARLGFNFTPHWEVEVTHDDASTEDGGSNLVQRDYIADQVTANYNFLTTTQRRLYPYVTGGVGRITSKITVQSHEFDDTSGLWVVGGGFRLFFNKSISLRVDGRFKTYDQRFDIADANGSLPGVIPIALDDSFTTFEITIGLFGITGGKK